MLISCSLQLVSKSLILLSAIGVLAVTLLLFSRKVTTLFNGLKTVVDGSAHADVCMYPSRSNKPKHARNKILA